MTVSVASLEHVLKNLLELRKTLAGERLEACDKSIERIRAMMEKAVGGHIQPPS